MEKDNSVSTNHKNLQALATIPNNVPNNVSPTPLNDIFAPRYTPYNIRNPVSFKMRKLHLAYNGTETLSHLERARWSLVPHDISLHHLVVLNKK